MYGILWTRYKEDEVVLTMCGSDYATLEVYLEDAYMHSRYWREGYCPTIVSVHKEGDRWVC